ncbi:MAG: MFS transporter [alpha proteobacterium MED-G10]|nr:MAG: MFS transporter [alpha proteobacterium MED-G10]|tara:strand:- start:507 stop:3608 length:3102 start_codon:yes stop_codon:yes gene_type:complete
MIDKILNSSKLLLTILFFLISFGLYLYNTLPRESDPDISLPVIYIAIAHKGISPVDSERLLIKPLEKELKNIEGLKKLSSNSFLGGGNIVLEFDAGFNSEKALSDARVKIDLIKGKLPEDTKEPRVLEINLSRFPVLAVAVSGKVDDRILFKLAKLLKNDIESISEVLEVKTLGERERLIEIIVNPRIVENYGLTSKDVLSSIAKSNLMIPAGTLSNDKGSFNVQVPSLIESRQDLLSIPIKSKSNSFIKLEDVAEVRDSFREKIGYARNNGEKAIILEVSKRTGENIIDVINEIKRVVNEKANILPNFIQIDFFQDESEKIISQVSDLENNVILATIIVFFITLLFMGLKSSVLVSMSIPFSFLLSMIILSFFDVTINVVVLFSLILSVGILIDGAIIVVEYANRRASEGISKEKVFILSAKKMLIPVLASTSTTLAAFFPLIFWPGIAGEFMFFLPVTLLAILSSSLVMALIFIPVIGRIFGIDKNKNIQINNNFKLLESGDLSQIKGIQGKYINILKFSLDNPKKLITLSILTLILIQVFYGKFGKGFEFFPPIEPDYAEIVIHARGNFSAIEKDKIVNQIENEVLKNKFIKNIYSRSGFIKGDNRNESDDVIGSIKIEFIDWRIRPNAEVVINQLKDLTKNFSGIYIEFIKKQDGPPKDKDIEIQILNNNEKQLQIDTANIFQFLKNKNWVKNIDTDLNIPGIEWELIIDRVKADQYGVDIELIGNSIQMLTHGLKVTEYMPKDSDEEIDIVIKYDRKYRTLDELDKILVEGKNGPVSLSLFVTRKPISKIGKITRNNSTRSKNIRFDVAEGQVANNKVLEISKWLKTDSSFNSKIVFAGQEEDQNEAKEFLIKAFFIAVFLITIILIATFNSFYFCFIILSAIIFSTIGVMIGLIISGKPFGIIMSGIGVIALAGIVVNNNIVLLDTYKNLRKNGQNIKEAILRTGAQRLRPVLLTTLTTFFGLIPMAMGLNINFLDFEINFGSPSSQWWLQLSNAIVFGVMFSFVLTLIITPCLIIIGEKNRFFKTF